MNKLYISDLDFTLLNSEKKLTKFSRESINEFNKNSINFTIASARSITTLKPLLGKVSFSLPIIEFNGGYLTNFDTMLPIKIFDLNRESIDEIIEISVELNFYPIISTYKENRMEIFPTKTQNIGTRWYYDEIKNTSGKESPFYSEIDEIIKHRIITFTYIGKGREINQLLYSLSDELLTKLFYHQYENLYNQGSFWLNIQDRFSTKENAIVQLRKEMNLEESELIVFGDSENDIGMMKMADISIAVQNAVPEVKKIADIIIGSNDEDSVCRYIRDKENL